MFPPLEAPPVTETTERLAALSDRISTLLVRL